MGSKKPQLVCYSCHRENTPCVVYVNAGAELSSICTMCLSQALREALKTIDPPVEQPADE